MRLGRAVIPISSVRVGDLEERAVLEVLRSGHLTQGRVVEQLESAFADVCGCHHVVAVNNGTSALIATLRVLGIGPGDEVVTSPFTFVATANAILNVGATVRFADIGDDFNVDVDAVRAAVTPKTRAIMPVPLYGQTADMPRLADLAQQVGVAVIEDAAQAHGAAIGGRLAGWFGVACFSLYANKDVFPCEGGLISPNDAALADQLRVIRNQGMRNRHEYVMVGENFRMTDVHAAIALPQLPAVEGLTQRRR